MSALLRLPPFAQTAIDGNSVQLDGECRLGTAEVSPRPPTFQQQPDSINRLKQIRRIAGAGYAQSRLEAETNTALNI